MAFMVGLTKCLIRYERTGNPVEVTRILSELTKFFINLSNHRFRVTRALMNLNRTLVISTGQSFYFIALYIIVLFPQ